MTHLVDRDREVISEIKEEKKEKDSLRLLMNRKYFNTEELDEFMNMDDDHELNEF